MKWKKGDWCFHDYELKQITSISKNGSADVSCGIVLTGGRNILDTCRPLTMENKLISDEFYYWDRKLREVRQIRNWPELSQKLESMWLNTIDEGKDEKGKNYEELRNFCWDIINESEKMSTKYIGGITVF